MEDCSEFGPDEFLEVYFQPYKLRKFTFGELLQYKEKAWQIGLDQGIELDNGTFYPPYPIQLLRDLPLICGGDCYPLDPREALFADDIEE